MGNLEEASGRFWTRALVRPPPASERWLRVGNVAFFVAHRFSAADSALLTTGVRDHPDDVVLTAVGNVRCPGLVFKNPLDPNTTTGFDVPSIRELATREVQYVYDDAHVISRNLRYMLLRQGDTWHLVVNPLHTASFRAYFNTSKASDPMAVVWGVVASETDAHLNVRAALQNYCDALHVQQPDGTAYLDPTCNLVYSREQCTRSSFFDANRVAHDAPGHLRRVLAQLATGLPPHCVCSGTPHAYVTGNHIGGFVDDFHDLKSCDNSLTMNVCTIVNEAQSIHIEGSSLSAECGNPMATTTGDAARPSVAPPARTSPDPATPLPDPLPPVGTRPAPRAAGATDAGRGAQSAPVATFLASASETTGVQITEAHLLVLVALVLLVLL